VNVVDADVDFGDLQSAHAFHRGDHVAANRSSQIRDGHAILDHRVDIGGGLPLADLDCHPPALADPGAREALAHGPGHARGARAHRIHAVHLAGCHRYDFRYHRIGDSRTPVLAH